MKVINVKSDMQNWDQFVRSTDGSTGYHRFGWKDVITKSFQHECYYLAAIASNGEWQGILPLVHMRSRLFGNFLVSVPFVNYGGLVCNNQTAEALLIEAAEHIRQSSGAQYVELRHVAKKLDALPTKKNKVTMILKLCDSSATQWEIFDPKLRNQIRKAQKSGLEFRIGGAELLADFYSVFARNMRDLGTPVYAQTFFSNVLQTFEATSSIAAVYYRGSVVAAGVVFWFRDRIEVPWASSIRDHRSVCPNHMLYWGLIQFAVERGFKEFDFGRSTPNEGTYNFKKQWGALPIHLNWQYLLDGDESLPELNPTNPKFRLAIRVWRRLPIALANILGPAVVRNIP